MHYQTMVGLAAVAGWSTLGIPGVSAPPLTTTVSPIYQQMAQQPQENLKPGQGAQEEAVKKLQEEVERLIADLERERTAAREQQAAQNAEVGQLRQELETSKTTVNTVRQSEQQAQKTLQGVHQQQLQLTAANETMRQRLQSSAEQQAQLMGRMKTVYDQATQHLQDAVAQQAVTIRHETDRVVLELRGDGLFALEQSGVPPKTLPTLNKIVAFLKLLSEYQVLVEGHTDAVPMSPAVQKRWGSPWAWSASRAATIVRYFETKGLPATQLTATGYGAARPIAGNDTEAGRAQNRRLEIVLQPPSAASKSP